MKESDVPLVQIPGEGWFNWYGGYPRAYDVAALRVDNNWTADSFEQWQELIADSMRRALEREL